MKIGRKILKKIYNSIFKSKRVKKSYIGGENINKATSITFYQQSSEGLCKINDITQHEIFSKIVEYNKPKKKYNYHSIRKSNNLTIDIYEGTKYYLNDAIKNIYFEAKKIIITVFGKLVNNDTYIKALERYVKIYNEIKYNSYEFIKNNKFLNMFLVDNDIDNDEKFNNCIDLLAKMYIFKREKNLYTLLLNYSNI